MSARPKRSPGLPVYLECPTCEGDGEVIYCPEGCVGGFPASQGGSGRCCQTEPCPEPRCFDGDLVCDVCYTQGLQPRVQKYGPDYIVAVLATRLDGEEAVCEVHFVEPQAEAG